jgi:hypothetical protein
VIIFRSGIQLLKAHDGEFISRLQGVHRPDDRIAHQRLVLGQVLVHVDHEQDAGLFCLQTQEPETDFLAFDFLFHFLR